MGRAQGRGQAAFGPLSVSSTRRAVRRARATGAAPIDDQIPFAMPNTARASAAPFGKHNPKAEIRSIRARYWVRSESQNLIRTECDRDVSGNMRGKPPVIGAD